MFFQCRNILEVSLALATLESCGLDCVRVAAGEADVVVVFEEMLVRDEDVAVFTLPTSGDLVVLLLPWFTSSLFWK